MAETRAGRVGFTCAYAPLPLIDAAGFSPFRILPGGDWPEAAGRILHDNLCPHVKRIIDRALSHDLPELNGMIFMNSCDAMRRLADAWAEIRPDDPMVLIDLPISQDESAVEFFRSELIRLSRTLAEWSGQPFDPDTIQERVQRLNRLSELMESLRVRLRQGTLAGGGAAMQEIYNQASTRAPDRSIEQLERLLETPEADRSSDDLVPVFLFGNMLPEVEAFALFESCGARIVGEDLCTGSRMFNRIEMKAGGDPFSNLARGLLARPRCGRSFNPQNPGQLGEEIAAMARAAQASSVIGHTVKFCDPYLTRMPLVRATLRKEGIPLLVLEGDLTLRSIGQQRTRIEAFVEMQR